MSLELVIDAILQTALGLAAGGCVAFMLTRLVRYAAAARTASKLARHNRTYALVLERGDGWPWRERASSILPTVSASAVCLVALAMLASMLPHGAEAIRQANASIPGVGNLRPAITDPSAQTLWMGHSRRLFADWPLSKEPVALTSLPAFNIPPRVHPDAPFAAPDAPAEDIAFPAPGHPDGAAADLIPASLPTPDHQAGGGEEPLIVSTHDLRCLAQAIYFEAAGEPADGQLAVAQVVVNRVRNPYFPSSLCGVVFENRHLPNRCQFSFACDGEPDEPRDQKAWGLALELAQQVIRGDAASPIGRATHFHATSVNPDWIKDMTLIRQVGDHVFYSVRRWS